MIKMIVVGKLNQKYLEQGITYYTKQIQHKIEWIEIIDEPTIQGVEKEGLKILSKIKDNDVVVACAIEGKMMDSIQFSQMMQDAFSYQQGDLIFVIGGSYGLSEDVMKRSNHQISFGRFTYPHQLMRLILIEQIYRGLMIQKNHPYHK